MLMWLIVMVMFVTTVTGETNDDFEPHARHIKVELVDEADEQDLKQMIGHLFDKRLYYLLKPDHSCHCLSVNESKRGLIDVDDCDNDEDIVLLKKHSMIKNVDIVPEFQVLPGSEISTLWNINNDASVEPSQYVLNAWDISTGQNVTIGFVEVDYMEADHGDLENNILGTWDSIIQGAFDGNSKPKEHGTAVVGVCLAVKNDFCYRGIAYDSKGYGISVQTTDQTSTTLMCSDGNSYLRDEIDIYNNAWRPRFCRSFIKLQDCEDTIEQGGKEGRDKNGNIFVWMAGNGGPGCNTNTFSPRNSIYVINVGSANDNKQPASYNEVGSSIMCVAYGGDENRKLNLLSPNSECNAEEMGTSFSSSTVSGVIALVFGIRKELGWRDIQYLLVCTSSRDLPDDDLEYKWQTNGGGILSHPQLGHGLVNAFMMVKAAMYWKKVPKMIQCTKESSNEFAQISVHQGFLEDSVVIPCGCHYCRISHLENILVTVTFSWSGRRGDVELYLVSPYGTVSYLLTPRPIDIARSNTITWTFKTVQHWSERPCGNGGRWTLRFGTQADMQVTLYGWSMTLYGVKRTPESFERCLIDAS